jgi:hypothetical protein
MSGLVVQRTVSGSDLQAQRQRAKEIYNRDNKLAEDIEREKREREAAAKRSREEAAERGRQASRDWAEKQRARKLAEGDKGMSAGYGPGGQMGLKTWVRFEERDGLLVRILCHFRDLAMC